MKYFFKTVLLLSVFSFLAACNSDKKDEEKTVGKASPRFEQMLQHVPADTTYLYTNKNILKGDLRDAYLKLSRQYLAVFAEELKTLDADKSELASGEKSKKQRSFAHLLFKSLAEGLDSKNNTTGLDLDGYQVFYGYKLAPVFRVELSDRKALLALIKKAETESKNELPWTKCGKSDCLVDGNEKIAIAIIISDKQLTMSAFQVESKDEMMSHLTGEKMPKKPYQVADWDKFLAENHFKGFGDGFVNLADMYGQAENLFFTSIEKEGNAGNGLKEQKACSALIKKHLVNMPSIAFGATDLEKKSISYEFVLKTSEVVSSTLKNIPNSLEGYKVADNPIIDFGLNLNFGHLKNALANYTEFLIESNKETNCDAIKPNELRKMVGSLSMATMFGADKFKSIYFAANNVTLDNEGKPKDLDVYASIGADDPASLVQMLAMVNPNFAKIKLPKDGSALKLPTELFKGKVPAEVPDIFLSAANKQLNIMVGNKDPKKKALKADLPTLFWSSADGQRYSDILMKILEQQSDGADKSKIESMKKIYGTLGSINQSLVVDGRGLVWKYQTNLVLEK